MRTIFIFILLTAAASAQTEADKLIWERQAERAEARRREQEQDTAQRFYHQQQLLMWQQTNQNLQRLAERPRTSTPSRSVAPQSYSVPARATTYMREIERINRDLTMKLGKANIEIANLEKELKKERESNSAAHWEQFVKAFKRYRTHGQTHLIENLIRMYTGEKRLHVDFEVDTP